MEKKIHLLLAVLATGMMSFAGVLIETAMNVTFPTLISEFGITTGQVQWVTTIYLLVIAIIVPFSTYLLKNFQIRTLFLASNLLFMTGLLIDFWSPNFAVLLAGRLLQGVSTGIALPLMFHIILTYTPIDRRGAMIGIGNLTTSIAPAIGPTYGGVLTSALSWHYIFLFLVPVLLLSLGLGVYAIPSMAVKKGGKLDIPSMAGIVLMFTGFLLFLNQVGTLTSVIPLIVGLAGLGLFYHRSTNVKDPLIRLDVLKNKGFRLFLLGFLVCQFLLLGISFVLPNFVQIVMGKDAFVAGLVMLPGAAVGAILAPISGRVLDNQGAKKPILFGLSLVTIGWLALTLLLQAPILLGFVAAHVFYMIGIGFSYSNMMTTGMGQISTEMFADGNAIFNTLQQFSGAVATAIVATIINLAQKSQANYQVGTVFGSQMAMLFLFVLALLVLISCVRYFKGKQN
ncbi:MULTISPECIES: MFS transporter [Enterococcus]|uniref:MFS transporter n=1 Tax=Enterococcus TaxID=1350 RepID=UPI00189F7A83|nr:MFS transporter [Enterococcus dispar]MCU7357195.1 MFS transporter [Enterococcus dispar]MDT2705275.1 MFS transporter [Enterococcus dispar]WCG32261.1 MFS transporter [Enterococcus dispar]